MKTADKLLFHARRLMWTRGYSAVSLREVCRAAGVDVSMVARHFGSRLGLFEATLETAFDLPALDATDDQTLKRQVLETIEAYIADDDVPSVLRLIIMNVSDIEVGSLVRERQHELMQKPLEKILGGETQAAYFISVLLSIILAETAMKLPGIAKRGTPEYRAQLEHMMNAALSCPPDNK